MVSGALSLAVLAVTVGYLTQHLRRGRQQQADIAFGEQHGCQPAPKLKNHWPLGVDRLIQIFDADTKGQLMALFHFILRQTGNTLEQNFLGTKAYATIEPANLEAILSSRFRDFGIGPRRAIAFPMFGDGIFTQEGPAWKHSRDLLRPQLRHKRYEDLGIFRTAVDDLIGLIQKNNGIVDLQPLFFRLTLDTTTAFLFDAFATAQQWVMKRFRFLDLYWIIDSREFRQACRTLDRFADQIISRNLAAERRNDSGDRSGRYGFLDAVAQNTADRTAMRGQIVNLLAAGRDTTACLLSWTFFLLVRHPNVMQKLREEIISTCGAHSDLHREDLKRMQYLQNVLRETLRLYPSVPVNTRTAVRPTFLPTGGGPDRKSPVLIPRGCAVAFSVYSMHRRPDLYGIDAELFRPERWEGDTLPLKDGPISSNWGFLPFHGGPRSCLGMDFALTEAGYTVVRLLQTFQTIVLPADILAEPVGLEKQRMTLVLSIKDGCMVEMS